MYARTSRSPISAGDLRWKAANRRAASPACSEKFFSADAPSPATFTVPSRVAVSDWVWAWACRRAAAVDRARTLGLARVFCLTFEVDFFASHGFQVIQGTPVDPAVYAELLRSHDDGVAEFLDLARVKPNTLGNTRMLLEL